MSNNSNSNESIDETKYETNDETKYETNDETKEEPNDETKEEPNDELSDELSDETKDGSVNNVVSDETEDNETGDNEPKDNETEDNETKGNDGLSNYFGETKEEQFLKETLFDIEKTDIQLSSDDDDDDDTIMIENNIEYNLLDKYHPDIKQLNNNELHAKTFIKRNKDGVIEDTNHQTVPIMTRYERAKIIGLRSTQINAGADILIDIPDNIIDGITIARMELKEKKIPFIVRRPLPNGKSEYWDINDLEILE